MLNSLNFSILKYTIILINILLFSQTELETRTKMMVLSCSKLLNQKYKEKPEPEITSKIMLSCFIKITQSQSQKIFYADEKDPIPLKSEEINELLDINDLKSISEEEKKVKSDLMNKFIEEIEKPEPRKLVQDNAEKDVNKDEIIDDNKADNQDDINVKDDNEDGDDDNDNDFSDPDYDPNYYGDDMNDEYAGGYDDYYDDYDDYYGYGNYNYYGNYSDEDYANMYGNNEYYDDDNKPFKVLIRENKGLVIFICCLVIMVILIAIFGKDYEETQTLDVDPNKNKNE
jgi:hypothetical protein